MTKFLQAAECLNEAAGLPKSAPIFDQRFLACLLKRLPGSSRNWQCDPCNSCQEIRTVHSAGKFLIKDVTWHCNSLESTCNQQRPECQLITVASRAASTDVDPGNACDTREEVPMRSKYVSRSAGMGRGQFGQRSIGTCPNIWWSTRSCQQTPANGRSRRLLRSTGTPCSKSCYQTRR